MINLFILNAITQTNLEMNSKEVDILNIILIIISLYAAFHIPFGLFIFSYVFLGPLHYLTEINWLKEKEYFLGKANWSYVFIFIGVMLSIPFISKIPNFSEQIANKNINIFLKDLSYFSDELYSIGFITAIGVLYFKKILHTLLFAVIGGTAAIIVLNHTPSAALAIAIFVPTLIHVYIFTTLFMIYGNIKNKTMPGLISILLMFIVPLVIYFSKINPVEYYEVSNYTKNSYMDSNFGILSSVIAKYFIPKGSEYNFLSVVGIKIQIFIAFAYTYHYLNWFSKTSIIRWDKGITKTKIKAIVAIWLISISIYMYNFKIGFVLLSFLSVIHVLLEFPLNAVTIKELLNKINPSSISKS